MKPIKFKKQNCTLAKDQPEYLPLPAHVGPDPDKVVTSCWRPSFIERLKILFIGRIYVQQMTFRLLSQPITVTLSPIIENPIDIEHGINPDRSVNCYFCGVLFDERDGYPADEYNGNDGGEMCPRCQKEKIKLEV